MPKPIYNTDLDSITCKNKLFNKVQSLEDNVLSSNTATAISTKDVLFTNNTKLEPNAIDSNFKDLLNKGHKFNIPHTIDKKFFDGVKRQ